jgi:hypothetical protein
VNFLKNVFSSASEASWSRLGSFMALCGCLAWDSFVVFSKVALPTAGDLAGQTAFIVGLYAVGKTGETVQKMNGA